MMMALTDFSQPTLDEEPSSEEFALSPPLPDDALATELADPYAAAALSLGDAPAADPSAGDLPTG